MTAKLLEALSPLITAGVFAFLVVTGIILVTGTTLFGIVIRLYGAYAGHPYVIAVVSFFGLLGMALMMLRLIDVVSSGNDGTRTDKKGEDGA